MNRKLTFFLLLIITSCITYKLFAQTGLYLLATMTGENTNDWFRIVKGVGDVNGDGFDDVLVGAPLGNYAKLYFGGSPFDTVADLTFIGEQPFSAFSASIAGADVNGDDVNDIIISATGYCIGGLYGIIDAGKVYIYFGGADIDTTADLTILPKNDPYEPYRYAFGHSLANAGDVNGDGYDDIIVSAPNIIYYGKAYIYFGGSEMDDQADVSIKNGDLQDQLGESVAGAGDVNGDGYDDVIIGVPHDDGYHHGKIQLYLGGDQMDSMADLIVEGDSIPAYSFGRIVSGLGDINNDGFADFGGMALPYIKIILGNKNINSINIITINERSEWGHFISFSDGMDINQDDYSDILLGVENRTELIYSGMALLFLGERELDVIPDYELMGNAEHSYFACTLDFLGDINGDNTNEIIIGEHKDLFFNKVDNVYIYSLQPINNITTSFQALPDDFTLLQNYPNPFNSRTIINYQLTLKSLITICIYNVLGEKVSELFSGVQPSGSYQVEWDGTDQLGHTVPSGIYLCQLKIESDLNEKNIVTIKMALIK